MPEDRWLANHRVTTLWSSPDLDAEPHGDVPQFSYFKQLQPQDRPRIFLHYFGNSTIAKGDFWAESRDLGPIPSKPNHPEPEFAYTPSVLIKPDIRAGTLTRTPKGVIMHGSRSGIAGNPLHKEFIGTANFALNTELGWNATIGDDEIAIHLSADEWGHNARAASDDYLAVEFAQPVLGSPITDGQIRSFCWWMRKFVLPRWPNLPMHFPTHSEVEKNGETGRFDGKSDVFRWQSVDAANAFRQRVLDRLADKNWSV